MNDTIDAVAEATGRGEAVALASLVESSGSIPMSDRAKMMVCADGTTVGTIGGGCLEAEIAGVAGEVLATGQPQTTRYTLTEEQAGEGGLNCGGTVRIYTEVVDRAGNEIFRRLTHLRAARTPCAVSTVLEPAGDAAVRALWAPGSDEAMPFEDQGLMRAVAPRLGDVMGGETAALLTISDRVEIFLEPFLPAPLLYVFGGGHVGARIGQLAQSVGFRVTVVDDRQAFADPRRHPEVEACATLPMETALEDLTVDEGTYIVAATRGHQHDEIVVEQAIRTPARYVGMLGSERKKIILWERIASRGGGREKLDQVYAPIGHNIGADTPEEIAVSVVAELIEVRRGARRPWKTKRPADRAVA